MHRLKQNFQKMHGSFIKNLKIELLKILFTNIFNKPLASPTGKERELVNQLKFSCEKILSEVQSHYISEKAWEEVENRIRKKILANDPRQFLRWHIILETMFVFFAPHISKELSFLKNLPDYQNRWRYAIQESPIGHPIPYWKYPQSSGNLIHIAYSLAEIENRTQIPIDSIKQIFEFGGGYGCACRLVHNLKFNGKYIIFDRPVISALQKFYLNSHGIETNAPNSNVILISKLEELKSIFHKVSPSLFIATWSISETPISFREKILDLISYFDMFLIAYQPKFKEVNNVAFFKDWLEKHPEFRSQSWRLRYLPKNTYLAGIRR